MNNILKCIRVLPFLFFIFSFQIKAQTNSTAELDIRSINNQLAQKILTTLTNCGPKIWPGYDLKSTNIVFLDSSDSSMTAVSFAENKIFSIPRSNLPSHESWFGYFKIENQNWMFINTELLQQKSHFVNEEQLFEKAFKLAIHESFHNTTQKRWNRLSRGSRGTFLPIKYQPRLYRNLLFQSLVEAAENPNDVNPYLAQAKYWFDKWISEAPEEKKSTTDGYEGTARYADLMGYGFSVLGCTDSSSQDVFSSALGFLKGPKGHGAVNGDYFEFDLEGYPIGAIASLLLDRLQLNNNWQAQVADGATPLELLMQNVTEATPSEIPADLIEKFNATQTQEQQTVDDYLNPTYRALELPHYFVSIPMSWSNLDNAVTFNGFFIDVAHQYNLSVLAEPLNFNSSTNDKEFLNASDKAVSFEFAYTPNVCTQESYWTFVVSHDDVSLNGNLAKLSGATLNGTATSTLKTDENGNSWLCVGE